MLAPLIAMLLAVPFPPVLDSPAPEGWTFGTSAQFVVGDYQDDAGVPPLSLRLEFRREDAGYGSMNESFPYGNYVATAQQFPVEGTRWCWRARHVNTMNQVSEPSVERCFRTDFTPPASFFVDAGAIVSTGFVALDMQPSSDALSGLKGYFLELAPTPTGPFSSFGPDDPQVPLQTFVGEGAWYGWVRVTDNALNDNRTERGAYGVPITITANPGLPVPEAPRFESVVRNGYGGSLVWDAGWMADAGVTHLVASYCKLDAGCQWRHGFYGLPLTSRSWLQTSEEGPTVARIAVVVGGEVGPWSAPSAPVLIDRRPPPAPAQPTSSPSAARVGPLDVSWTAVADDSSGLSHYLVLASEQLSGVETTTRVNAPAVMTTLMPSGDGRFTVRVAAVDLAGNQSGFSVPASSVIDSQGPTSQRPTAAGVGLGGSTLVTISWALPVDALSDVSMLELLESSLDGGSQLVRVTGLNTSRTVPPGEWRWQLRGTDSLGNVGLYSEPSNTVLVTLGGVVNGPAITTTELSAQCDVPLSVNLMGEGTPPLTWSLLSGPQGLEVSGSGRVTWTPPSGTSGAQLMRVKLTNLGGSVNGDVQVQVSCAGSGAPDAGTAHEKAYLVGCGCSVVDPLSGMIVVMLLRRRRS